MFVIDSKIRIIYNVTMKTALSEKIVYYRKLNNLTQAMLAEKLFVLPQTVSSWERGITCPDAQTIVNLCKVFNISADELLGVASSSSLKPVNVVKLIEGRSCDGSYDVACSTAGVLKILIIAQMVLLILSMILNNYVNNNVFLKFCYLVVFGLSALLELPIYCCFIFGKKTAKNLFLVGAYFLTLIARVILYIILVVSIFDAVDKSVIPVKFLTNVILIYSIVTNVNSILFPFAFKSKDEVNVTPYYVGYFILVVTSSILIEYSANLSIFLLNIAIFILNKIKKDRTVRYYYYTKPDGTFISYRDYKRELTESYSEVESETISDKNNSLEGLYNASYGIKIQVILYIITVILFFSVGLDSYDGLSLGYTIQFTIQILIALLFILLKRGNVISTIISTTSLILYFVLAILTYILYGVGINAIYNFLPYITFILGFISFVSFTWFYKSKNDKLFIKILVTLAMLAFTVWFTLNSSYFLTKNLFYGGFIIFYFIILATAFMIVGPFKRPRFYDKFDYFTDYE